MTQEKKPYDKEYAELERQKKILLDAWTPEQHQEYARILSSWEYIEKSLAMANDNNDKNILRKQHDKVLAERIAFEKETGLLDIAKDFAMKMAKKFRIGLTMPQA